MALNNQNETYYHHLQHNSHLKEYITLLTKKFKRKSSLTDFLKF